MYDLITCPKCGAENGTESAECRQCGLFFEKYRKIRAQAHYLAIKALHNDPLGEEARLLFEKLKESHPELIDYADQHLQTIEAKEGQRQLDEGIVALEKHDFKKAMDIFAAVKTRYPAFADQAIGYLDKVHQAQIGQARQKAAARLVRTCKYFFAALFTGGTAALFYYWLFYKATPLTVDNRLVGVIAGAALTAAGSFGTALFVAVEALIRTGSMSSPSEL